VCLNREHPQFDMEGMRLSVHTGSIASVSKGFTSV